MKHSVHFSVQRINIVLLLQKAKLCSSEANKMPMALLEAGHPVLVGTNKCTQGPAYWCASQENAEHCGVSIVIPTIIAAFNNCNLLPCR